MLRSLLIILVLLMSQSSVKAFSHRTNFYRAFPHLKKQLDKKRPQFENYEYLNKTPGIGWFEDVVISKDTEGRVREVFVLKFKRIVFYARAFDIDISKDRQEASNGLLDAFNRFTAETDVVSIVNSKDNHSNVFHNINKITDYKIASTWIPLETRSYRSSLQSDINYADDAIGNSIANIADAIEAKTNKDSESINRNRYTGTFGTENLAEDITDNINDIQRNSRLLGADINNYPGSLQELKQFSEGVLFSIQDPNKFSRAYFAFTSPGYLEKFRNIATRFFYYQ